MADGITIAIDLEVEYALEILTRDGSSSAEAIRRAVLEAAMRMERTADRRRAVLRMPLGEPDGVDVAAELSAARNEKPT
jgi:hypothetical protein